MRIRTHTLSSDMVKYIIEFKYYELIDHWRMMRNQEFVGFIWIDWCHISHGLRGGIFRERVADPPFGKYVQIVNNQH